jgi:succinate dehydrogenase/fumarate reductase flavoprotein subunit
MNDAFDLVIVGSGAGGMAAACVGAAEGLRVLLVEKSDVIGGTTALSGGMVWIPDNHHLKEAGLPDSLGEAMTYLTSIIPEAEASPALERYIADANEALLYLEKRTELRFQPVLRYPDYFPDRPGATLGGRVLEPVPFDARALGSAFRHLRAPLPEFTLFGGMMVSRADIPHFREMARRPRSALRVAGLILAYAKQRLSHHRGTSLVLGNALAGRLYASMLTLGVTIRRNCALADLIIENGRCIGIIADHAGQMVRIASTRGVVLASGGFGHSAALRQELMPDTASFLSATVRDASGDGISAARRTGADLGPAARDAAFWVPVSSYVTAKGRKVVYPHTVTDRAKPGVIAVDRHGKRFVNEAVSYHEFVRAMLARHNDPVTSAHLICDATALWKYGLGAIKPFTANLSPYLEAGYLMQARSPEELAVAIGVPVEALERTIRRFNEGAATGSDPEYGKGENAYQRHLGDADVAPNPCVAPLRKPPYCAVAIAPGDLGTARGLRTDGSARVLDGNGDVIAGLYAAGADASSIMRGNYPGPGITLGPALTLGYRAARTAAENPPHP